MIAFLRASTAYVAGSIVLRKKSQPGRFLSGKRAALKKKRGNTTKLIIN
jgi:hypothetical protein